MKGVCTKVTRESQQNLQDEVSDRIFTVANVITFIRLCMAPIALGFLLTGNDVVATILFAFTAATDFLDGQIARRTHTVSKLGQLLDPAVDRVLMICGVIGLMAIGRLPVWIVVLVLARDVFLLAGGSYLLREHKIRIPVIYAGKFATTFLFVGIAGLMLNMPLISGFAVCNFAWLPGFNGVECSWGIWFIYLGLCLGVFTTVYYIASAIRALRKASNSRENG